MSARKIGGGQVVSMPAGDSARGKVAVVTGMDKVLELLSSDELGETLLWTSDPTVTAVAPVLEEVAGVLCTTGGPTAHVAIVARDLGLLCLMQCKVDGADGLDGAWVQVSADGTISREE